MGATAGSAPLGAAAARLTREDFAETVGDGAALSCDEARTFFEAALPAGPAAYAFELPSGGETPAPD